MSKIILMDRSVCPLMFHVKLVSRNRAGRGDGESTCAFVSAGAATLRRIVWRRAQGIRMLGVQGTKVPKLGWAGWVG